MTNLLDIPGLSSMSDTMIMDTISSYLVLPNRLLVPLVPDLHDAAQLRCPLPRGVVRVHLFGARELRSKDRFMGGLVEGKSDPYAVLRVGTQVANSRVVPSELSPTWDEVYEFIVHEVPGQEIEVELFDKDPDQDDLLGRMKLDFGEELALVFSGKGDGPFRQRPFTKPPGEMAIGGTLRGVLPWTGVSLDG
ncbi:extended synaptotagmin-1 [Coturnix japonica]|uniref:extended synaptotagmin-1 n=1 Tax=Coturnix japonica TaxID=93934 RepID=UPI000776FA5B|nr:extended synaptotagmin-1 [Coturnix japonica]